jgi:hypothetical protein
MLACLDAREAPDPLTIPPRLGRYKTADDIRADVDALLDARTASDALERALIRLAAYLDEGSERVPYSPQGVVRCEELLRGWLPDGLLVRGELAEPGGVRFSAVSSGEVYAVEVTGVITV